MKNTDKTAKLVNQGYSMGLFTPIEFSNALKLKMDELKHNSLDKERWTAILKGFELGLEERLKQRKQVLAKTKKGRSKTQGRTR